MTLKRIVLKPLQMVGYTIVRINSPARERPRLMGATRQLRALGVQPATIFDVGVAEGTSALQSVFPRVPQILIEPLKEFHPTLEQLCAKQPNLRLIRAAAGKQVGMAQIRVNEDLYGSSLLESPSAMREIREVPVTTIDTLVTELNLAAPFLIKIDAEGVELDILTGSVAALRNTQVVIVETILFKHRRGAPSPNDLINFMATYDFELHDIVSMVYRPLDNSLSRCDLVFAHKSLPFRQDTRYQASQSLDL